MKPLEGIRVLDLSRLLPGPYCSLILADLGAEVIKVEDPQGGDYARWMPPMMNEIGVYFLALNRNKKSLALNLKSPQGIDLFKRLVEKADVVLESFRPGVIDRLGIGYDVLSKINKKVILCSISGYGQKSPYRDRAGHDLNYTGIAGVLGLTGRSPQEIAIPGAQVADVAGGSLFGAIAILSALMERERRGEGRAIDISMTDGAFAMLTMHLVRSLIDKTPLRGATLPLNGAYPCYRPYATSDDRFVALGALEMKFWERFCRAIGRDDLREEAYRDDPEIHRKVEDIFRKKTQAEWVALGDRYDFCCTPVYWDQEIVDNPHVKSRELVFHIDHPTEGEIPQIRIPIPPFGRPSENTPPPALGEHTEAILQEIGISKGEREALRKGGVIG